MVMNSLNWSITNKMLWSVGRIEAGFEVVEGAEIASDWEMRFREEALIRSVTGLCKLEGMMIGRSDVEKLLKAEAGRDERPEEVALRVGVVAKEREIQSVLNKQNAYKYVEQLVRLTGKTGLAVIGEKELLQIHSLLSERMWPSHTLGVYRTASVEGTDFVTAAIRTPPLSIEVPYQMEDVWLWYKELEKEKIYPAVRVALVMSSLVKISPFTANNGSAILLFGELLMGMEGRGFRRMISIPDVWMGRESELIGNLSNVNSQLGETTWTEFFLDSLASEVEVLKVKVRRLGGGNIPKTKWGKQVALTERQIMLMEVFQTRGEMTMLEAKNVLPNVSEDTILRDLSGLINKKLIRKRGKTKGSKYILTRAIL